MTAENTHALDGIELADAVASIRNQLIDAATRATDHPVSFAVGDIQMEFTLELRREAKAGGKVKAWVVEAGADAARTTGRTHKVAFTLTPSNAATGEAWEIGTEDDGSTASSRIPAGSSTARPWSCSSAITTTAAGRASPRASICASRSRPGSSSASRSGWSATASRS